MNNLFKILILSALITTTASCLKDRDLKSTVVLEKGDTISVLKPGDLRINEIVASGSNLPDDRGTNNDWVELYNTTDKWIKTRPNNFWVSDNKTNPQKYQVKNEWLIPPKGFLLFFAIGGSEEGFEGNYIHANFGFSASGEDCVVAWRNPGGIEVIILDEMTYENFPSGGRSLGLRPNGTGNEYFEMIPTPEGSNL